MISNTEIQNIDEITEENLELVARMIGQTDKSTSSAGSGLPRLAIEQDTESDSGEALPKGHYRLRSGDHTFHVKSPVVRFFVRYFTYDLWNAENPEDSIRSVMKASLRDEFPDSSGGMKSGKLSKKEAETLTPNSIEAAKQKLIKTTQVIYGIIHEGVGVTVDGEEQDLKGTPFIYSARGSAYVPVSDHIKKLGSRKIMFSILTKLATQRHKNGAVVYYSPVLIEGDTVKIDSKDMEQLKLFFDDIEKYNSRILKSYNEHQKAVLTSEELDIDRELEVA